MPANAKRLAYFNKWVDPVAERILADHPEIQLLRLHRYAVRGSGRPLREWKRLPPMEEIRASIHRKIDAVVRAREAGLTVKGEGEGRQPGV